ncbi:Spectrin beta chain, non-erythrocytic 1, partial [Cichlidogyrus casuarinus]
MVREGHPQSEHFRAGMNQLTEKWDQLKKAVVERTKALKANEQAQQYLFDASEAEAWMGEQELYLMGEERERAKDDQSVNNAVKRQELMQKTIETYGDEIRELGVRAHEMSQSGHPELDAVTAEQARVDKQYAGLRDLCVERKQRLEDLRKLYNLLKEITDLEAWIAERTQLASSHELGADYEHNCVLRDRFAEFSRETNEQGRVRVAAANDLCNSLIDQGHAESAEIAECKDRVNEAWADLLELIETRIQHLRSAWDLHKFYCECQDVLDRIAEKSAGIPEDLGKDAKAATSLQRKHTQFETELQRLAKQVEEVRSEASLLLPKYAHDKEHKIQDKTEEVLDAWRKLQCGCEQRKVQLHNACDLHRFLSMYRKLRTWMEGMDQEMANKERPRDVSGVELLMNNHRSVMAEIEARDENFSVCLSLGRNLLNRRHPLQEEVRANCIDLVTRRINLLDDWRTRKEHLELMLEVYQYAREAAVAEAWLFAQEPYLKSQDLGESLDETLALLKKHAAFERHADTQKERFENLKRLTN